MNNLKHEDPKDGLVEYFKQQQEILEEIYKKGFSSYVEEIHNISDAFREHDHCIRCMDEGTPGGFHSAGSGILRNEEEVLSAFKKAGVKKITSHDGCGAAGLYAKAHGLDLSKADEHGKEFSKRIAEKLGVPYEHINAAEMNRPAGQHIARVAYYDNTGKFNYFPVNELPSGFIISRGIQTAEDSLKEMKVAFEIATGHHGYGELITEENPFIFSIVASNEAELNQLKSELSELGEDLGKKIKIDGFIAPSSK